MRVYIRPIAGGRTIPLSESSSAVEFQPRWSPAGNQILYLSPSGVFVASALGGAARQVAAVSEDVSSSSDLSFGITGATWSSDGNRIMVANAVGSPS
ncbi:MAG: TolB family protein [Longimicrobiales bacterium]